MIRTGTWYNPAHTRRFTIDFDDNPVDPRENCNIASLWCEHPRLSLGDDHAENDLVELIQEMAEAKGINFEEEFLKCPECAKVNREDWVYEVTHDETNLNFEEWQDHQVEACESCDNGDMPNPHHSSLETNSDILECLQRVDPDEEHIFRLPLFLMDHGNVSIKTSPFSCSWDSGNVGMAFISKDDMVKEGCFGATNETPYEELLSNAHTMIKAEVAEYDSFISGDAYSFKIEELNTDRMLDHEHPADFDDEPFMWEEVDACHGFLGDDAFDHMLPNIDPEDAHWIKEAMK